MVATTNHSSVRAFHYKAPAHLTPAVAPPPIAANNPLARLLPEDQYRLQQDLELQAEADRAEAEAMEQREQAELIPATDAPVDPAPEMPIASAPVVAAAPSAPAAVFVLELLGVTKQPAAAPAASTDEDADEPIAEALYENPLTTPAPTKNDEANRLTAVALRQRNRAALKTKTNGDQKAALLALLDKK